MSHTQDINNKVQNIKNAAMRVYGSQGLGASLEDVAADAGVTTEEILAEFSSVEELQSACTNEVFDVIEATHGSLNPHDDMLKHLATADEYEPVVRYLAMCLRTGGDLARRVVEQMIADADAEPGPAGGARDHHRKCRPEGPGTLRDAESGRRARHGVRHGRAGDHQHGDLAEPRGDHDAAGSRAVLARHAHRQRRNARRV